MAAVVVDIADAVVASLNAATFSQPFTAQRLYVPLFKLEEMDTLHVSVVPRGDDASRFNREVFQEEYQIDIGVQQRVDMSTPALDALVLLVQEIKDHLKATPLADFPEATFARVQHDPFYSRKHLLELRQFTAIPTVTYRVWR